MPRTIGAILDRKEVLAGVVFDIIQTRTTARSMELTSHPIEGGGRISDHTISNNIVISFRGEIGNLDFAKPLEAYDDLVNIFENREIFDYQTGLELFPDMVITSLTNFEDPFKPGALIVDIVLEQITITKTEEVRIPPEILKVGKVQKQTASQVNRGLQEKKEVESEVVVKSYVPFELIAA